MPTLDWIGKQSVVGHHREVPYRLLHCDPKLSAGDPDAGNLLVQGDNLEALKALLPYYGGQVKCIYIDPPYNTGNEGWIYNDNVNSPEIRRWLGEVVGKEAEDLSRHDKWLCMMYPRLILLKEFLRDDGLIFVSIDDNESGHLRLLLDEIFGRMNFQQQFVWKNKYGPGARTRGIGNVHEYIFCYSKPGVDTIEGNLSAEEQAKYKKADEAASLRGPYITQPLMTKSKDDRPNLVYPIVYNGEEIWPEKQWIWSRDRLQAAIEQNQVVFRKTKGRWSVRFKQYLRDETGNMRKAKPISLLIGPFNQDGTKELDKLFGSRVFNNPKPVELIKYLTSMIVNGEEDRDGIIMDSFAGSGSTGQAVIELNRDDGGNRKCLLVEINEEIAEEVTANRLKQVVKQSCSSGFRFCRLGKPLFDQHGSIDEEVSFADLARHVFFTETGSPIPKEPRKNNPLLGVHAGTAIYLLFNGVLGDKRPDGGNVLTHRIIDELPDHPAGNGPRVVYGEACRLSEKTLASLGITFRQIPFELRVS